MWKIYNKKTKLRQIESKIRSTTEKNSSINCPYKEKAT